MYLKAQYCKIVYIYAYPSDHFANPIHTLKAALSSVKLSKVVA